MEPNQSEKQIYGGLTVYRTRGQYLRRLEQYDKAEIAHNEAFKIAPEDVRNLEGRALACTDAFMPQQANANADLALSLEPNNLIVKNVKANAMYAQCEFERSVIMCYSGQRLRRRPTYFTDGINQGEAVIQNCVGKYAGNVLVNNLPLILKREQAHLQEHKTVKSMHKSRIPKVETKKHLTQLQTRQHELLSRVLAMKYFGPMAYDKFFLEDLLVDPRINSANAKGSNEIREIIKETLNTLRDRQEMLRAQRPYYAIKLAEQTESKHETRFRRQILINEREINKRQAEHLMRHVEKCMRNHHTNELRIKAERMQSFLDSKTPRTLPTKDYYTDRLYRAVGEGYLAQHRISFRASERSNRRRVAFLMGLPIGRPTSFDSVIANYPFKYIGTKEAVHNVTAALETCENSYMKCWLMYELARLLTKQKNYAMAKFYAKRCQREAQEIGSVTWWMNGCFVLIGGDMQQGNQNEVRVMVEEACQWLSEIKDNERLHGFLEKCADISAEPLVSDDTKAIARREIQILNAMEEGTRKQIKLLFKRMSLLPNGRRFSVLPQRSERQTNRTCRHKHRQHGLSIVPGVEKGLPRVPRSKVLGFQIFDL
ncbi:outer dynein arm-docking complex subunit 4-like [Pectinophora gossypiella]|uniref:outer dynein arm-docking complex subunit 4-like n=1 Tax=Pectinophora gossypiella TaxID=13191 RepID=UPI00214E64E5|nr:outer dynein arm-docking complex subunit 4-like [Pectinophora gossypiella]